MIPCLLEYEDPTIPSVGSAGTVQFYEFRAATVEDAEDRMVARIRERHVVKPDGTIRYGTLRNCLRKDERIQMKLPWPRIRNLPATVEELHNSTPLGSAD